MKINSLPDPLIECDFDTVYYPSDDSYLLIDYFKRKIDNNYFDGIPLEEIEYILDMGTGTGIIAIFFQLINSYNPKFNPRIFASDILEEAIKCAKSNEKRNKIDDKIIYLQSDLFKSFPKTIKSKFNIIVFNPPYLPSSPNLQKKSIDHSWEGGLRGIEITLDFIRTVGEYLNLDKPHCVYFISSSRSKLDELQKEIKNVGFTIKKLEKVHIFFEDIILNRLQFVRD